MDIQQRINKTRGAFSRLKNIWSANNISLHLKIKLFNVGTSNRELNLERFLVIVKLRSKVNLQGESVFGCGQKSSYFNQNNYNHTQSNVKIDDNC